VVKITDQALVTMLQRDNEEAFREIYNRHWKNVYTQALIKTGLPEDARDLTQEIFLYLWKKRHEINITTTVPTYLQAALRHKIIDYYRGKAVKQRYYEQAFLSGLEAITEANHEPYQLKELTHIIESEIQLMPARMKEIFLLSRDEDLPSAQIAARLELSDQTVRNQISTAIQRIRKCLMEHH